MNDGLTPKQVKAARALLAWSQGQLATEAKVGVSTVADFERGARDPVHSNAQAIRDALEAKGLQFIAGGVVGKGLMQVHLPHIKPGKLMRWIDATALDQWADRRDAQSGMAELLRRLTFAQVGPGAAVHFPSDESVQFPGWDGVCSSTVGTQFIPEGTSGWEIGTTGGSITAKATSDLAKRTANPGGLDPARTTFVFVTPRRFTRKESWLASKRVAGSWRDIRVIDADDLVHWLELEPAVAQWLAVRIGRRPEGLQNLEETWEEWSKATNPPLGPSVLLADRDVQAAEVHRWVMGSPAVLPLQAESPQEAVAFLYAALQQFPDDYCLAYCSRAVVATNHEVARQLVGVGTPLIVVVSNPDPGLTKRLVEGGHHVFAAYGPDISTGGETICLQRPWTHTLEVELAGLETAGLVKEKAHQYARACGRSITALRRLMPSAAVPPPVWATQTPPQLLAAMLAGSWDENSKLDCRVLEGIAGCTYEELERTLVPLTVTLDGPLRRVGGIWKVVSLRDLWGLLAPQLTPTLLKRFGAAFQEVLGARDPRFAAAARDTWFEKPGQYGDEASSALRRGLAEAMIALGVYPQMASGIPEASGFADQAIKQLLGAADAHLWWSLSLDSRDLRRLAEASPKAFLDAVHGALEGENPPLMIVFRSEEGPISTREYQPELLWALEVLARSPDYLMRAAQALARLAELDPQGKLSNRPKGSLRGIFVCWAPQTSATLDQRMKVIDAILRDTPEVGWHLLVSLAPNVREILMLNPHPDWRDFSPEGEQVVTYAGRARAYREIGRRLLGHVGVDAERWTTLLNLWMRFDPTWRDDAAERLKSAISEITASEEIEKIREAIRDLLQHHREFPDQEWAKPEEELAALEVIFALLEPKTAEERHRWLFNAGTASMRPGRTWEEAAAELQAQRRDAAKDLVAHLDSEGLVKFAGTISHAFELGMAIVENGAPEDLQLELLRMGLGAEAEGALQLAGGVLSALHKAQGDAFIDKLWERAVKENWGEQAELHIVRVLPVVPTTWARVAARSSSLDQAYWKRIWALLAPEGTDHAQIVDRLIQMGRGFAAVEFLGHRLKESPAREVLVRALRAAAKGDDALNSNDTVMFTHYLARILEHLEKDLTGDINEVASLEWAYFEALRYSERPPRALYRVLAENPEFFADLIKMLYRPAEESGVQDPPPEDPEAASRLASHAFGVLREWSWVPGADEAGVIDGAVLGAWVTKARKLCKEAGRLDVGDSHIGQTLAVARRKDGELWPPEPVCDLMEVVRSRSLERGFEIGVYNSRGVHSRAPFEGGKLERGIAASYRREAEAIRFDYPRAAACLERIAESYDRDALHQDQDADHRDWL